MKKAVAQWCERKTQTYIEKKKFRAAAITAKISYLLEKKESNVLRLLSIELQNKKYKKAIKLLDKIIKQHPKNIKYKRLKGVLYGQIGKYEKAIEIFITNIKEGEKRLEDIYLLGKMYEAKGNNKQAKKYYQTIIETDTTFAKAYFRLADIYLKEKQYEKAAKLYLEGLEIRDSQTEWLKLAYCYIKLEKLEVAEKILQKVYETRKEVEKEVLILLIMCHKKMKKKKEVEKEMEQLKEIGTKKLLKEVETILENI